MSDEQIEEQITGQTEWQEEMFSPEYDLAGLAMGALDDDDAAHVQSAIVTKAQLRTEFAELESAVATLALFASRQHINRGRSAGIRSRLIARAASARDRRIPVARRTAELVRPKMAVSSATSQKSAAPHDTTPSMVATGYDPVDHRVSPPLAPPRPSGAIRASVWVGLAVIFATIVGGLQEWRLRKDRSEVRLSVAERDSSLTSQIEALQASMIVKDSLIQSLTSPTMKVVDLVGSASLDPIARVFWDQKSHEWTVRTYGLRQPRVGKTYQVWLIANNTPIPISIGTFEPDAQGSSAFTTRYELPKSALVRITVSEEPAGGVPVPTGPVVAAGK